MNYLVINTTTNKVIGIHTAPTTQDRDLFLQKNTGLVLQENAEKFEQPIGYTWDPTTKAITVTDNSDIYNQLFGEPIANRITSIYKLKAILAAQNKTSQVLAGLDQLADQKLKTSANMDWQAADTTPIAIESPISVAIKQILTINDTQLLDLFAQANNTP